MSKLEELKKLRESMQININGIDNFPKDIPCVIITNHNRLMDIFYIPCALSIFNKDIISLISARLVYKQDIDRLKIVNKYLNAFPIEAHGGKVYSDMCLKYASKLLKEGNSVSIFPEGAYLDGKEKVYKGRTGAARILFESLNENKFAYLLPVSIDIETSDDLDSYIPNSNDKVNVNILNPIDPIDYYNKFNSCYEKDRKIVLHDIIDIGMIKIAKSLNRKYIDNYIELFPKGNVIFSNSEVVEKEIAQDIKYINRYEEELKKLYLKLK